MCTSPNQNAARAASHDPRFMLYSSLYPWLLLVAALDIIFTRAVLGAGGIELNPTAAWVIERADVAGMIVFKFLTIVVFVLACEAIGKRSEKLGRYLTDAAIAVTAAVVIYSGLMLWNIGGDEPIRAFQLALRTTP